jgi:uncharacterized protein with FMN-binding domain
MKKILVIALAVVMLVSVFALTACDQPQTVSGEYAYDNTWVPGAKYGVKVDVTVKGDIITKVVVTSTNTENYTNASETTKWDKAVWENGQEAFLASFEGKTIQDVLNIRVACAADGAPKSVEGFTVVAGATNSSGRTILAIQNAIKQLGTSAYGRVHKKYAGKATVYVVKGQVVAADLDEACLPTQVTSAESLGDYTVEVSGKHYYKTVKFADVTMVYDATAGDYMVGTTKAADWLVDAANSQKYYEAAAANQVKATVEGGEVVMTASQLLKSLNNYWPTTHQGVVDGKALGWKANVVATCKYVVENGFAAESFSAVTEGTQPLENELVDNNGIKTGATWTDFADYFKILKAAFEAK